MLKNYIGDNETVIETIQAIQKKISDKEQLYANFRKKHIFNKAITH